MGGWVILTLALLSSIAVAVWPIRQVTGLELWTFAKAHGTLYQQLSVDYNQQAQADGRMPVNVFVIDGSAMTRRTLSGFWSGTPLADLIEVERTAMPGYVSGPLEDVGFVDLTDRLKSEELSPGVSIYDSLNTPSFGPWMSRGRIFGLPHDVHPVMLAYRADLVEAAGIDVSAIETWDDFERLMAPLKTDLDGDGAIDRWLLNNWYTNQNVLEALILQADGGTFDASDNLLVASEANAKVLARTVHWTHGPSRIAVDAPEFSPSGNQMKLEGRVIASIMPDWLAGIWMNDLPQLRGKVKLMPLPAWEPGGRRTSVRGGTMIGIPKAVQEKGPDRFEAAWDVAKHLYLSKDLARELFESNAIISPVKAFWSLDFYHQPNTYFSGQQIGTRYLELAPHVPFRSSNTYHVFAMNRIGQALVRLRKKAEKENITDLDSLAQAAQELLVLAEQEVIEEMSYNVFLASPTSSEIQTPLETPSTQQGGAQ
ncbi:MAG: extracellular solute-binding protein [Algisphaera sp.]